MWTAESAAEQFCDTCDAVGGSATQTATDPIDTTRLPRQDYQRDSTYDSGRIRLIGGYERAYYSDNGDEYAIDSYGDSGLMLPHFRDWTRGSA